MAEELNCDLDEGSRHDGSDGGSKSSAEDAQEHANGTKENFHPTSEKVEDVLDLDYDEGSPNAAQRAEDGEESSDGEIEDSSDENKNKEEVSGDKEEGEIDDSEDDHVEIEVETTKSRKRPIEARLSRPAGVVRDRGDRNVKSRECPYEINGACTWGPDCKYVHRIKEPVKLFNRIKVAEETSWERGLREAREAMRRASKKREEPEFETKRLTAAPTGERIRSVRDSDSDDASSPHRRSPQSSRHHIPSLLDITTLVPPRFQNRSSSQKDGGRNATRGSPCYSDEDDLPVSRQNRLDGGRIREGGGYRERREIKGLVSTVKSPLAANPKDLGPQVRYPCGRPPPPPRSDRNEVRRSGGDSGNQRPPPLRQEKVRDPVPRLRRDSPHSSSSTRAKARSGSRISPSLDASPISSDSSLSPARSPRRGSGAVVNSDKSGDKKVKRKLQSGGAMGEVTDPWARKKKTNTFTRSSNEVKTRGRSSSNSSSSSSNSNEKIRRAATASSSSRALRRPRTPPSAKIERRLSPPRGDIAGFRIPKKDRGSPTSRDRLAGAVRTNNDAMRDSTFSKKSSANAPPSKKQDPKKSREPDKVSDDEVTNMIESRGAQKISDSESAHSVSRSSSAVSSSSSRSSSQSRSASPALPAKYRVVGNKEEGIASVEKNVSSVSDSDDELKRRNHLKVSSKMKRAVASPRLHEISPSPSPPPPPPPPDDASNRRRQREKSVTPPPPPPPLPLINEFVLERQARKSRELPEKRPAAEKSKRNRSPPKKRAKGINEEKERRKRELMEQLRAVEAELKKRTAATSAM